MRKPILFIVLFWSSVFSSPMDLSRSDILISSNIKSPVRESIVDILQEEVARRTSLEWRQAEQWNDSGPTLAIVLSEDKELAGRSVPHREGVDLPETRPEGYRIVTQPDAAHPVIWIIAADTRAFVYGVGHLLRHVDMTANSVVLNQPLDIATAPEQSVRGHQLGYRNTANSYDAWDADQYDQYIRELALFGTNAVENIPFGKGNDSELMPIPRQEMNIEISKICKAYDLDYWVWTPATFDLTDTEKRQAMLDTHEQFYQSTPRLDHIFFPGGDPGHNHPRHVMPFLKDLHERLIKYHPEAGIWISLQGFSAEQIDYFYTFLEEHEPDWAGRGRTKSHLIKTNN